jgi:hypothetical protein
VSDTPFTLQLAIESTGQRLEEGPPHGASVRESTNNYDLNDNIKLFLVLA